MFPALLLVLAATATATATVPAVPMNDAPTGLTASLTGSTVTLTWTRPASVDPVLRTTYGIRLNGELETIHRGAGNVLTLSIPRVNPDTTHEYTVQISRGAGTGGPLSEPAILAVPPAADTSPPTEPEWVVGVGEECAPGHEIVVQSVDDVTPQPAIRYEGTGNTTMFRLPGTTASETYVWKYHLPIKSQPNEGPPDGIRAVDEAGNRSDVELDFEMSPSCG